MKKNKVCRLDSELKNKQMGDISDGSVSEKNDQALAIKGWFTHFHTDFSVILFMLNI